MEDGWKPITATIPRIWSRNKPVWFGARKEVVRHVAEPPIRIWTMHAIEAWKTHGRRMDTDSCCTMHAHEAWKTHGRRMGTDSCCTPSPPASLSPKGWANSIDTATGPGSGLANSDTATDPQSGLTASGTANVHHSIAKKHAIASRRCLRSMLSSIGRHAGLGSGLRLHYLHKRQLNHTRCTKTHY